MSENRSAESDSPENANLTVPPRQCGQPPTAAPPLPIPSAPSLPGESGDSKSDDGKSDHSTRRRWSPGRRTTGLLSSVIFHAALLIALAMAIEASRSSGTTPYGLEISRQDPVKLEASQNVRTDRLPQRNRLDGQAVVVNVPHDDPTMDDLRQGPTGPSISSDRSYPLGIDPAKLLLDDNSPRGGGLEGRGQRAKAVLLPARGGTRGSEEAVERGLRWLAAHQRDDGSWNFNHHGKRCRKACRNPGTEMSTTAATAMALLPFLGAGYTHTSDEYAEVVGRGLYYLSNKATFGPHGADLQEGTMYAQGLCTIALCEAYAMSGDKSLKGLAQRAIDFIDYAQDKKGGGWRYQPGQPGDTTVTGWQLMALKSGLMAKLNVPSPTIPMAERFLDGVSSEYGSRYGYMSRRPGNTTTAIGLLARMYTGWRRDRPALEQGAALLDKWGPSKTDMYFNYYATQVLCHRDGPPWKRWNTTMRDYLIATQVTSGHEAGSWYFPDHHGNKGGRLYNTAMAIMTLEVYYRYMPLYEREAIGEKTSDEAESSP